MTLCIVGFDDLVISFVATIATGWSVPCRVGLSPTERPRLYTAHTIIRAESSTDDSRLQGALSASDQGRPRIGVPVDGSRRGCLTRAPTVPSCRQKACAS